MKFKLEKKLKIINELITLFHKLGTDDVHVDLKTNDYKSEFLISGLVKNISNEEISRLKKILNTPRQHEVEQYYWNLNGSTELNCELMLVGMMIDIADINYDDQILSLHLIREENDD